MAAEPTEAEQSALDRFFDAERQAGDRSAEAGFAGRRDLLLPALLAVQNRLGWVSTGALNETCKRLRVPPAEAYGVASFYALISLDPQPPIVVHVCDDIACMAAGAERLCERIDRAAVAGTDRRAIAKRSPCLGLCDRAPAALVLAAGDPLLTQTLAPASAESIEGVLDGTLTIGDDPAPPLPQAGDPSLRLLARAGRYDPQSLDGYRALGGYRALRAAVEMGPERVIRELLDANLLGRGGAAFPAGRKWEAVAKAPVRPHYFVCNADESEPGTFKDKLLLERDPFAVVEAVTIGAYAAGCEKAFVYIRGEYPLAARRIKSAIAQAKARGFLGKSVLGKGVDIDIETRLGGGAYICGEETALLNSIEGYRGEPRNKPPFPVEEGLFGKPTVINNVETLVNVLDIVLQGGKAFAASGPAGSSGTRLFCVSGHVRRPGVYETRMGMPIRELIELAGSAREGRTIRAILLGGAAGSFIGPAQFDAPLSFEGVRSIGATLGSGVVLALDDSVDLIPFLARIAAFFRDESCGQCVPCRVGTVRQEELLARLASGAGLGSVEDELALFGEIRDAMKDASICGLGQTAASAIDSAIVNLGVFRNGGKGLR